ncbi:hypothetical protein ACLF3G_18900 [Falsiroseomonas sp. HC035]|uniref:hypothetical protein n=1 Tax=Falsiroseomonas sp. HC035 TaxID=3390999 RepID=UPI003D323BD3
MLSIQAGAAEWSIEHASLHPTTEPVPAQGFILLAVPPPAGATATPDLILAAGTAQRRVMLAGGGIETDPGRGLATADPQAGFALLRDAASSPAMAGLLDNGTPPFGGFGAWIARIEPVRGKSVEGGGGLEEAETLTSAAGEVLVVLRGAQPFPPMARVEAVAIGVVADAEGVHRAVPVPLLDWQSTCLPQALVGHAQLDPAWLDRLDALELVLAVHGGPDECRLLRCRPRAATAPDLLDAVCRTTPFAERTEAGAAGALALLRLLIARREARLAPVLASLATPSAAQGAGASSRLPRMALLLGADDPFAARLFQVTAAEIESRCDSLLVLGDAATEVAEVFLRRGRIPVQTGAAAAQALRRAAGCCTVLPVPAARFAEAVARGRPAEAMDDAFGARELALLTVLHGAAGCEAALADTLARLLRLRRLRSGEAPFLPVQRGWTSLAAADLVNRHLSRLWQAAVPPEESRHG